MSLNRDQPGFLSIAAILSANPVCAWRFRVPDPEREAENRHSLHWQPGLRLLPASPLRSQANLHAPPLWLDGIFPKNRAPTLQRYLFVPCFLRKRGETCPWLG